MGTPERQTAPLSVILGKATYWHDELNDAAWMEIVQTALSKLGELKNVSGFKRLFELLNKSCWYGPRHIHDNRIEEFGGNRGLDSLCREMAPISDVVSADRKSEKELFLLKSGGFAILSVSHDYYPLEAEKWFVRGVSLTAVETKDLTALAARANNGWSVFWARLFQSIYELAREDRDLKRGRADLSSLHFLEIDAIKSRINLPDPGE